MRIEYIRSRQQYASVAEEIRNNDDIVLIGLNCHDKGEEIIFEALERNSRVLGIRYLDFKPDRSIVNSIIRFLAHNTTVKTFEIALASGANSSSDAIRSLLDIVSAFPRNKSITTFRIENFVLQNDADALDAFSFMIAKSERLQILSFLNCKLFSKDLKILAKGVQSNPDFRVLRIQDQYWHQANVKSTGIIGDLRQIISKRSPVTIR